MRKVTVDNPRYPHHIKIVRREVEDRYSEGEPAETVVYEGVGRSYTDTTTTGDKKVDTNKRKASVPVRYDEWEEPRAYAKEGVVYVVTGTIPMSGDILIATKGNITEEWEVKDFEPDNNRSVIYGEMNRNADV